MQLPAYRYEFYDDHLRLSGEGSMAIPYESIERLVEDKKYYYLFTGPDTVMMLDRGTIGSEPENFRKFLQEKTGKEFRRARNLLLTTLRDLLGQ